MTTPCRSVPSPPALDIEGASHPVDAQPVHGAGDAGRPARGECHLRAGQPQQKRDMVQALQSHGHNVAMTGDGVGDVLALKDADIGVSMGSGSEAARAVAQIVLLDSSFSSLPSVVAEGRRVIGNIERVANLFLTKTAYAVILAVVVVLTRSRIRSSPATSPCSARSRSDPRILSRAGPEHGARATGVHTARPALRDTRGHHRRHCDDLLVSVRSLRLRGRPRCRDLCGDAHPVPGRTLGARDHRAAVHVVADPAGPRHGGRLRHRPHGPVVAGLLPARPRGY